ncbi:MAG: hypothetical protein ACE5EX_07275 [Phycisphaerae bacterium]
MNFDGCETQRDQARSLRRPPEAPTQVVAAFADPGETLPQCGESSPVSGDGMSDDDASTGPIELTIEATNAEKELAPWLDDDWWTERIQRWAGRRVTVLFAPTPAALLHAVVLLHVEMLRRVVPEWRTVGYGYVDDVPLYAVPALAGSRYDEVRLVDQLRPGYANSDRRVASLTMDELIGWLREEEIRLGVNTPVLVRLPSGRTTQSRSEAGLQAVSSVDDVKHVPSARTG